METQQESGTLLCFNAFHHKDIVLNALNIRDCSNTFTVDEIEVTKVEYNGKPVYVSVIRTLGGQGEQLRLLEKLSNHISGPVLIVDRRLREQDFVMNAVAFKPNYFIVSEVEQLENGLDTQLNRYQKRQIQNRVLPARVRFGAGRGNARMRNFLLGAPQPIPTDDEMVYGMARAYRNDIMRQNQTRDILDMISHITNHARNGNPMDDPMTNQSPNDHGGGGGGGRVGGIRLIPVLSHYNNNRAGIAGEDDIGHVLEMSFYHPQPRPGEKRTLDDVWKEQVEKKDEEMEKKVTSTCVACMDKPACMVFVPCGCLAACQECVKKNWEMADATHKCFLCRELVSVPVHISQWEKMQLKVNKNMKK